MELGLAQFWAQGDVVTHSVATLLVLLSVLSWYVIATRPTRLAGQALSCARTGLVLGRA
jgi:biopolymer transport protein ExbB/TolQ